jgi:hypothetical protein
MSSTLLEEVPQWAILAFTLVLAAPSALVMANMVEKDRADKECFHAALQWEQETSNGALFRAADTAYFATLYRSFRVACPSGNRMVNESSIPAAVKEFAPASTTN